MYFVSLERNEDILLVVDRRQWALVALDEVCVAICWYTKIFQIVFQVQVKEMYASNGSLSLAVKTKIAGWWKFVCGVMTLYDRGESNGHRLICCIGTTEPVSCPSYISRIALN